MAGWFISFTVIDSIKNNKDETRTSHKEAIRVDLIQSLMPSIQGKDITVLKMINKEQVFVEGLYESVVIRLNGAIKYDSRTS